MEQNQQRYELTIYGRRNPNGKNAHRNTQPK